MDSKSVKSFIDKFEFSYDIIKQNIDNFIAMYSDGSIDICNKMIKDSSHNKENLKLIVKATLFGKLKNIKFIDEDFKKELSMNVSQEARYEWKENMSNKGDYTVYETYDFLPIVSIGAFPVNTCQHYSSGSYRQCLLSNFDTNKKVILVKKNERIVGRALIRLTKSKYSLNKSTGLGFADIENLSDTDNEEIAVTKNETSKLTLFLEKAYISDNSTDKVREEIINLCIEKAKVLGARLVVSSTYSLKDDGFEEKGIKVYASRSKNRTQYLDSCGGYIENSEVGKYKYCKCYVCEPPHPQGDVASQEV